MYAKFTDRARKVMQLANREAERFSHEYIGTEHILLGLIREGTGVGANLLKNLGVDFDGILREIEKLIARGPEDARRGDLPSTPRAKQAVEYAMEEARLLNHNYVGTEHLLLGLMRETEGVAHHVLVNLGLNLEGLRNEVRAMLAHGLESDEGHRGDEESPLPTVAPRQAHAHKGDFGLALLVGGSQGMGGAIGLAGKAALRGGAGLVRLAVPDVVLNTVAAMESSYMTVPLPADPAGRIALAARDQIVQWAAPATVVGLGPGLGRSLGLDALVSWLYANLTNPMVVDADGLNALAARPEVLAQPAGPRVLTPHPGEFARLLGTGPVPQEEREASAAELAARCGVVVVLKGHQTCTTDGTKRVISTLGNPGMATGGSGDVLTGLIAALVCQGLSPFDAARLGVYLHGLAGDLAAGELGQESLMASDLTGFLPKAFQRYRAQHG